MKTPLTLVAALAFALVLADEAKAPEPHLLTFKAADGSEATAIYYPPVGHKAPGILCFHALGRSSEAWGEFPARLQAAGYAVLSVTLRGHPESGPKRARGMTWIRFEIPQFRDMVRDVEAARACLASQREVDGFHLALLGEEFGANLALAGGQSPTFRAAILLTPRVDARGIPGPEALAAFGDRPCLAVASADDAQGIAALDALQSAAKGKFDSDRVSTDASDADYGAAMLSDPDKPGLSERILAWLKSALPASGPRP